MAKARRSLVGKVVAITGGARGIGRATAAALIAQGARVGIGDIDAQLAQQTAQELGGGTVGLPLDVTDRASFAKFLDDVEANLGPLDVLINNAGIMPIGPFVDEEDAVARTMVDINLHGVIFGSKLALSRFMPRGSGHLVNIASAAGKAGFPSGATYSATKHAVVGLSEALRAEARGTDIGVTVVIPVVVHTQLGSGLPETRGFKAVEAEDVAAAIVDGIQLDRFEVYVPSSTRALFRLKALVPTRMMEAIARFLKGDQVLATPDPRQRAEYDARMTATIKDHDDAVTEREKAAAPASAATPRRKPASGASRPRKKAASETASGARKKAAGGTAGGTRGKATSDTSGSTEEKSAPEPPDGAGENAAPDAPDGAREKAPV
jgi:NADP-dependent 3-hydroxy acid dehydrogenase YdfG